MHIKEDLARLVEILPKSIQETINEHPDKDILIEIIMDLGRRPEARFPTHPEYLSPNVITWQDLDYSIKRLSRFADDNRAGIERTLHRISCIRNRQGLVIGLTCRVGRAMYGTINSIRDLLESGKSILILGKPGVGKTTMVREIARVLANEMEKRVVIIDTSNEIGGDSDITHSGIGRARRMQVPKTELQHQVMIEAVENHMPQVIIIDEIGTELEVLAARTIAEKGVQLIGTTHGNCLENLIKNPPLSDLIGGIQYVTLSDDEAKRRGTQKSVLERKAYPAFEIIIEINHPNIWTIHENVATSADLFLRKDELICQTRKFQLDDKIQIQCENLSPSQNLLGQSNLINEEVQLSISKSWTQFNESKTPKFLQELKKSLVIYPYSISKNFLKEVFSKTNVRFTFTNDLQKASVIIGVTKYLQQNSNLNKFAKEKKIPVYSFDQVSLYQLTKFMKAVT